MASENQRKRSKFRASAPWKKFRKRLKEERKVCEVTQKPLRAGFQIHHMDLDVNHYEILDDDKFVCLNRQMHEMVHNFFRYYQKDPDILSRFKSVLDRMVELNGGFLC